MKHGNKWKKISAVVEMFWNGRLRKICQRIQRQQVLAGKKYKLDSILFNKPIYAFK